MPYILNYRWPGNVRELENLTERLVLLSRSDEVTPADLPEKIRQALSTEHTPHAMPAHPVVALKAVERDLILQVLTRCNWNQSQAARDLDISRKTLLYRMRKYGISGKASESVEHSRAV